MSSSSTDSGIQNCLQSARLAVLPLAGPETIPVPQFKCNVKKRLHISIISCHAGRRQAGSNGISSLSFSVKHVWLSCGSESYCSGASSFGDLEGGGAWILEMCSLSAWKSGDIFALTLFCAVKWGARDAQRRRLTTKASSCEAPLDPPL